MGRDFKVKSVGARPTLDEESARPDNLKEAVVSALKVKMKRLFPYLLIVAVLVATGVAVYFEYELEALKKNPQAAAQEETQKLLADVSKLIVLPEGESPIIATVADPSRLSDQPFFAKAKTGDKVLIYSNNRKAILYDPVDNKIVEVAPINIGNSSSQIQETQETQ